MTPQQWRERELCRARELVKFLDPADPHRLGLYALLELLADEAREIDRFSSASIAEREIHDSEHGNATPAAAAYALFVCGQLLGHGGEEGWAAICARAAQEKGLDGCFPKNAFRIIQRPHAELNWTGSEEDAIKEEIAHRRQALEAAIGAARIEASTVQVAGVSPRRSL